jgi:hypothetical protein
MLYAVAAEDALSVEVALMTNPFTKLALILGRQPSVVLDEVSYIVVHLIPLSIASIPYPSGQLTKTFCAGRIKLAVA